MGNTKIDQNIFSPDCVLQFPSNGLYQAGFPVQFFAGIPFPKSEFQSWLFLFIPGVFPDQFFVGSLRRKINQFPISFSGYTAIGMPQ